MDLSTLLSEFRRTKSDPSELSTFFSSLTTNPDTQGVLLTGLNPATIDPVTLGDTLALLVKWYRHLGDKQKHMVLQYLPNILLLRLGSSSELNTSTRQEVDSLLLMLYNCEGERGRGKGVFRIEGLAQGSIYHDGSRMSDTVENGTNSTTMSSLALTPPPHIQITSINSQNRLFVVESLYRAFNSILGDLSKNFLANYVKVTKDMLHRGYQGKGQSTGCQKRVCLNPNVLLELLYGAYFAIYNGFQPAGTQILEQIRQRGAALGSSLVLVSVNAIRTLVLTSGPSQLPSTATIATPSQIAKNLITNASFRAKKMGDDIPKVASEIEAAKDQNQALMSNNLKALANMASISEELVEDVVLHKTPTKTQGGKQESGKDHPFKDHKMTKDKLAKKIAGGFKKKTSDSESESKKSRDESAKKQDKKRQQQHHHHSESDGAPPVQSLRPKLSLSAVTSSLTASPKSPGTSMNTAAGASNTPSSATSAASEAGPGLHLALSAPPVFNNGGMLQNPNSGEKIESMEQIEELIKMKRLPADTVVIHSPESGTTIF